MRIREAFVTEKNLQILLRTINPQPHPEPIAFSKAETAPAEAICTFREAEGLTVLLPTTDADRLGLPYSYVAAWITLTVESDLDAVGFLAAITQRLALAGISCNVVSAVHHDHLFVPFDKRDEAVRILRELQTDVRADSAHG
jgi:uncharacterized protein